MEENNIETERKFTPTSTEVGVKNWLPERNPFVAPEPFSQGPRDGGMNERLMQVQDVGDIVGADKFDFGFGVVDLGAAVVPPPEEVKEIFVEEEETKEIGKNESKHYENDRTEKNERTLNTTDRKVILESETLDHIDTKVILENAQKTYDELIGRKKIPKKAIRLDFSPPPPHQNSNVNSTLLKNHTSPTWNGFHLRKPGWASGKQAKTVRRKRYFSDFTKDEIESMKTKAEERLRKKLFDAESKIMRLESELAVQRKHTQEVDERGRRRLIDAKRRIAFSEGRVHLVEKEMEKMRKHLHETLAKEKRAHETSKDLFERFADKKIKRATANERKWIEVVYVHEKQKQELEREVRSLRNELKVANEQQRHTENRILEMTMEKKKGTCESVFRPGSSPIRSALTRAAAAASAQNARIEASVDRKIGFAPGVLGGTGEDALRRKLVQLELEIRNSEKDRVRSEKKQLTKLHSAEEQIESSLRRIAALEEENAALQDQLTIRPSSKQWREAQRKIKQLERRCELNEQISMEASDEFRKHAGTLALIRRDKEAKRLQLHRLHDLPGDEARDILRDICRKLQLSDVSLILPAIERMECVIMAVPRMEAFVREVCTVCNSSNTLLTEEMLDTIVPQIKRWRERLQERDDSITLRKNIMELLVRRQEKKSNTDKILSNDDVQEAIRDLINLEQRVLHRIEVYESAEGELTAKPNLLINKIVVHFKRLFDVNQLEGVLPKMNEIYLLSKEMTMFIRQIASLLKTELTPEKCLQEVQNLINERNQINFSKSKIDKSSKNSNSNYVVSHTTKTAATADDTLLMGTQQVRSLFLAVKDLRDLLDLHPKCSADDVVVAVTALHKLYENSKKRVE
eukprot:g472.t1